MKNNTIIKNSNNQNTSIVEGLYYKIKDQKTGDIINIAYSGDGKSDHDVHSWKENPGWNITSNSKYGPRWLEQRV